jgi:hypothetical protein
MDCLLLDGPQLFVGLIHAHRMYASIVAGGQQGAGGHEASVASVACIAEQTLSSAGYRYIVQYVGISTSQTVTSFSTSE